jgi:hypothetical protein
LTVILKDKRSASIQFENMKKYLFYFALAGWVLGLTVHILSLANIDVTEKVPFVWLLHVGIFIVWLPVVFSLKENQKLKEHQQSGMSNRMNPFSSFKIIFRDTPTWLSIIAITGFFYAFINFILFMTSQEGTPSIKEGQYVLHNHGQIIKTISEQEYHHFKANEVRGFSGHWILFYGVAAAVLFKYSGLKKSKLEKHNKLPT